MFGYEAISKLGRTPKVEAGGSNPLWDATNTANAVFFVLNQYNQFLHKSVKVVSGTGTKEDPYILTGKPGIVAMLNGLEQSYEQNPTEKSWTGSRSPGSSV